MFTVIACYRTSADDAQAVAELLAGHAVASEREPGCRQFFAHQSLDDPTRFFLYETYDSPEAFAAHRRTEHFQHNIERTLAPLMIEREWHRCSEPLRAARD
jgi:quinol monooxygenase YgiN